MGPFDFLKPMIPGMGYIDGAKAVDNHFFQGPANEAKAGYDQASAMSQQNLAGLMKYIGGQQQQQLGYYKPLQAMFDKTYGGGVAAPQAPKAPGVR